ncbi:MAG TPA: Ig-like domain-containing protein [Longimicrobiaceae bacterium]|nr:Ig-like domain-containing protein [Longimicrobiaceae bacterium]
MNVPERGTLALLLAFALAGCAESTIPQPPRLEIVSGDAQSGPIFLWPPDSLVVRATDAGGNPLVAWPIEWEIAERNGSIHPDTVLTDTAGVGRAKWVLGPKAGEQRVSASVQGSNPVTFHAQADPGKVFVAVWRFSEGQQPDTMRIHAVNPVYIEEARRGLEAGMSLNVGGPLIWGDGIDPGWPYHFDPRLTRASDAGSVRSCAGVPPSTEKEAERFGYTRSYCPFDLYLVRIEDVPEDYLAQLDSL